MNPETRRPCGGPCGGTHGRGVNAARRRFEALTGGSPAEIPIESETWRAVWRFERPLSGRLWVRGCVSEDIAERLAVLPERTAESSNNGKPAVGHSYDASAIQVLEG